MSSVGGYCSELRSIATITATMLPVSPFTAIRGVCVWECVCEQWFYTHTHTGTAAHTLAVPFSVRVQWQTQCSKGGQSSSANCMRWECATAVSDHAPAHLRPPFLILLFCFLHLATPYQPPPSPCQLCFLKNCSLQMTNFTFSRSQACVCVCVCECYLFVFPCSCCEFHFVTLSPPPVTCLYCLTHCHSKFFHTDCCRR